MKFFFQEQLKRVWRNNSLGCSKWIKSMNEYAAEFLRLSRFALYMVTDEEKRADRFQQKLKMNIQVLLIPQQLKTYAQVLTIA